MAKFTYEGIAKGPHLKMGNYHKWVEFVESKVKETFSPYAILQMIQNDINLYFDTEICLETLYNNLDMNISNKDLPVKKDEKCNYNKIPTAPTKSKRTSISQRVKEIEHREAHQGRLQCQSEVIRILKEMENELGADSAD